MNLTREQAIENLHAVLCDPEGRVCIAGSDEDRRIIQEALRGLSAGVTVRCAHEWYQGMCIHCELPAKEYRAMIAAAPSAAPAHTDHPARHYDRTCPACIAEGAEPMQNWIESVPVQPVAAVTPDHTLILYNDDAAPAQERKWPEVMGTEPRGCPIPGACACPATEGGVGTATRITGTPRML